MDHIDRYNAKEFSSSNTIIPIDVMFCGSTGAGKSTTINWLAGAEIAKVGHGCNPETHSIIPYRISKTLRCWDTPGLGDSPQIDSRTLSSISSLLIKECSSPLKNPIKLIDFIIIILNSTTRDLSTTYTLIDSCTPIIDAQRIIVAINQIDIAMYGRHWNYFNSKPDGVLIKYINEKKESTLLRIKETTGIKIDKIVSYSAKYRYNIYGFLSSIFYNMPSHLTK